ncbi:hypothetical protein TrRE_jg12655 [Triparma retinervis]|uniref:Uncharacterized protein n=1 Tax=Triparma retinervis TaxID=2557542 RepID=A0A9W7DWX1_9STRA|nr:hypothetical protein TrRE_jg12655 [Triparma retinervis]
MGPDGRRTLLIRNKKSPFYGEQLLEVHPSAVKKGRLKRERGAQFKLILTKKLLDGEKTRLMALNSRRNWSGAPADGKLRTKEEAVVAGTLTCNNKLCGAKAGDQYGRKLNMRLNVLHFDADGLSPKHQKNGSAASNRVNVIAGEIATGVSQWLCKNCHPLKTEGYSYLYKE